MDWTLCFSCCTAERGGAEEWKSPAGRRVCRWSRWFQILCKMYLAVTPNYSRWTNRLSWFLFCALLLCRKRSCHRLPETEQHPHGLQGLHHCQQGVLESCQQSKYKAAYDICPILFICLFNFLSDDADKLRWRLRWRRCGDVSFPTTQQQEGEHPSLANGSCTRWVGTLLITKPLVI